MAVSCSRRVSLPHARNAYDHRGRPEWLKIGLKEPSASLSYLLCLLLCPASKDLPEQTAQKQIHHLLVHPASNARKEDVCRVHADIRLDRQILTEAIARRELLDEQSITRRHKPQPLRVPMP